MATPFDVPINIFIERVKDELKTISVIQPPEWAMFVRTGLHKQRPPEQDDWWYYRAASILYQIYKRGVVGLKKLRNHYGGRKDRGHQPEKKVMASGKIIRTILQQLESAGLIEKHCFPHKKYQEYCAGRKLTSAGRSLLDKIATRIANELGLLQ